MTRKSAMTATICQTGPSFRTASAVELLLALLRDAVSVAAEHDWDRGRPARHAMTAAILTEEDSGWI